MKTIIRSFNLFVCAALLLGTAACEKDKPEEDSSKDKFLQTVNEQFVDKTVVATYKTLADKALDLQEAFETLASNPTDANVLAACNLWKDSRKYWELSEAFLFGAASKYYIDPHIDTWPLDATALNQLLNNDAMMADIENVVANLNNGLVGFHGVEYIIFREGQPRAAADIPAKELSYAVAVAKDLSLSCCRLEAAWAGMDKVTAEKREIIEDAEMEPEDDFGEQMRLCGQPGSLWKSITAGSEQIIEGCKTIVDEVGNSKIGKPYTGEDINYIESPHAYNSITDFYDNIVSVRNVYFGGLGLTSPAEYSLSSYIKSVDQNADADVIAAIDNCLAKIQAMPAPFVLNYTNPKVQEAIDGCNTLNDALEAARKVLLK